MFNEFTHSEMYGLSVSVCASVCVCVCQGVAHQMNPSFPNFQFVQKFYHSNKNETIRDAIS